VTDQDVGFLDGSNGGGFGSFKQQPPMSCAAHTVWSIYLFLKMVDKPRRRVWISWMTEGAAKGRPGNEGGKVARYGGRVGPEAVGFRWSVAPTRRSGVRVLRIRNSGVSDPPCVS